jgi:rubrerythrin
MSRERVILEIENLEQALKVEETIKTGYCDMIVDNVSQWIAVEEDLANSYRSLIEKSASEEVRKTLAELEQDSRQNLTGLHSLLETIEEFSSARVRREKRIEDLMKRS